MGDEPPVSRQLYQRRPGLPWRRLMAGVLLLDESGSYLSLEGAGAMVWLALEEPASLEEMVEDAVDLLGSEPEVARAVLSTALLRLEEISLVTTAGQRSRRAPINGRRRWQHEGCRERPRSPVSCPKDHRLRRSRLR